LWWKGNSNNPLFGQVIDNYSNLVIREKYLVYLSGAVPGHRKLLPRPCPQCGQENGGVQFVFFNPRYYKERTGYSRDKPYHLLRISHYSKEEYRFKKHKPTKIWHTFRFKHEVEINKGAGPSLKVISIDELFNEPDYMDKKSLECIMLLIVSRDTGFASFLIF